MKKKLFVLMFVIALALGLSTTAFAAGKLEVTDQTMSVCEAYSGYTAYIYAVVENTGDKPVEFSSGVFELYDADGETLGTSEYPVCYPNIIAPGAKGYLCDYLNVADADSADYIADYALNVIGKSSAENTDVILDASAVFGMEPYSYTSSTEYLSVTTTITNSTEDTVRSLNVIYAMFDADGKIMYVDYARPSYIGLPAGQSIELRKTVEADLTDKWEADGVKPASVEAIALSQQG